MNKKLFFPTSQSNSFFKKESFLISLLFLLAIIYFVFCPTLHVEPTFDHVGPLFSYYTALLFINLYLLQILRYFEIDKKIRYSFAGTGFLVTFLLFMWECSPFASHKLFDHYLSSTQTLIIFQLVFLYEIFRIKIQQPHIVLDIFFFLGLLPLEISIIGYISHIPLLYSSQGSTLIGLSIPTMTFFCLYFVYNVLSCKNLITHRLIETDVWSRNVLLINWTFWVLLIGQYSFYLQSYKESASSTNLQNIVFVLALMLFIQRALYFLLLKSILKKRFSLITLCAVSKKVETPDGNWIEIEKYLKDEHFISTSHSLCPEEVEKIKAWTKD